jgi:hypothetical protein
MEYPTLITQMMRKFFEEKLSELQAALEEKEKERDQLRLDLELAKKRNSASPEMIVMLQQKQEQIDALKRLESNYKKQAIPNSRSLDIDRLSLLQKDVITMKKRKADLQKELASEKKLHLLEMGKLNKAVLQKDREISKFQKLSTQQAVEIEKAKAVSKTRLEELTQLKKAIRNYKRGVGLDPVIVGRRQARVHCERQNLTETEIDENTVPSILADKIRDYFDSKVSSVVRKEAMVDRLAQEWEEYFELVKQRQLSGDSRENQESLDLQIQFKNEKIRKIAERLQRLELPFGTTSEVHNRCESFIFDDEFQDLCSSK